MQSQQQPEEKLKNLGAIYNPNNILVEKRDIHHILLKAGIKNKVNDIAIWRRAFTHSSYSLNSKKNRKYNGFLDQLDIVEDENADYSNCLEIQEESSERLEWLGDGIIQAVTASYLWKRFSKQDEGFLTKLRSKLVKTDSLSKLAKYYNFEKHLVISKHIEENCNGRNNLHILEDSFEAFIGAMYVDFGENNEATGYGICRKFLVHTYESCVDFTDLIMNDDNYKDQLMRFYQKNFNGKFPIYSEESYDEEKKIFNMCVMHPLTSKIVGRGRANAKKKAEQFAAKNALQFFNVPN
jgi:ribonuclease-3